METRRETASGHGEHVGARRPLEAPTGPSMTETLRPSRCGSGPLKSRVSVVGWRARMPKVSRGNFIFASDSCVGDGQVVVAGQGALEQLHALDSGEKQPDSTLSPSPASPSALRAPSHPRGAPREGAELARSRSALFSRRFSRAEHGAHDGAPCAALVFFTRKHRP